MKTVKERDDLDLLTLVCELHARSIMHMTKELHDASVEARQELESRIVAYQNLVKADVIKSVCPKCACEPAVRILGEYHCEICGHSGW
jgi:hypothetical protein